MQLDAPAPKVSDLGPGWSEVFSGQYSKSHGGVAGAWSEPWAAHPEGAERGDHVLELVDRDGAVLVSVPFNAREANLSTTGETLTDWYVGVVDPPEYASYRIVRLAEQGERVGVFEFVRSRSAPVMSLESPDPGEVVEGPSVELRWTVSDADGDMLSMSLYLSVDGGDTYRMTGCCGGPASLSPDRYGEAMSYSLDRARLEGSQRARVMVVVSDGARWAAAESPVFSSAAPYVREPVVQDVPVEFVASAHRGDGDGTDSAALAGVTVAIVEWNDRERWWEALGVYSPHDGTGIRRGIPPGAQVASTAEQVAAAPARFVTTSAEGTAHAELDRSTYYLFCAMSPDDAGLVAGCTNDYDPLRHSFGAPVTLHIAYSHGRAYLSAQAPAAGAASGPGTGREAPVAVVATKPAARSYANALGELVWRHLDPNQDTAVIADADIGRWWDTISGGGPAALDTERHDPIVVAAPLVEASPARVITTDYRGVATASLPVGNYLLCAVHRAGRIDSRQLACIYHHISDAHDNIFHAWCCGAESGSAGIEALNETAGRALIQQAQHLRTE